jgi:hypothetical protein
MPAETIDATQYPQLHLLLWNRADSVISEAEAFAIYEANWRFIDRATITPSEDELIKKLIRDHGNGCLNV